MTCSVERRARPRVTAWSTRRRTLSQSSRSGSAGTVFRPLRLALHFIRECGEDVKHLPEGREVRVR